LGKKPKNIGETILKIRQEGVTLLVADQNLNFARKLIAYAYVIDKGRIQHEAPMEDFWKDEELVHKYLAV
jgi:ABC-type branched-subunit amino acid transport system ATPase component